MKRLIGGYQFSLISNLEIERDAEGAIIDLNPIDKNGRSLSHAPFCRFTFPPTINKGGVYSISLNDQIVYVGETNNLLRRFGPGEYGEIRVPSPANSQTTNRRVNHGILEATRRGDLVYIWFHESDARKGLKNSLIDSLDPEWNLTRATTNRRKHQQSHKGDHENWKSLTRRSEEAKRAFIKDRIEGERLFAKLLILYPEDGMIHLKRAEALEYTGDTASAVREFELAEQYCPLDYWKKKARAGLDRINRAS